MRIAVIGCGFFAQNHLHAWRDIDGAEVVALCDTDPARLDATSRGFGVTRRYSDAAVMFADGGIDVADIATTVPSHRPLVELAARHGVHVICQKPFAKNMEDARAMVSIVADTGKVLMVHENFRWQSAVRSVIDLARDGAIGDPFFGRISFRSGYDVFSGQHISQKGNASSSRIWASIFSISRGRCLATLPGFPPRPGALILRSMVRMSRRC